MWYCLNCHHVFDSPKYCKDIIVVDPYPDGPMVSVCPYCLSDEFVKAIQCDCCGEYIEGDFIKIKTEECFCENCYTKHDILEE